MSNKAETLLAIAERLKQLPTSLDQRTKKPKPLTKLQKQLIHIMLHERDEKTRKPLSIRQAAAKAGYSDDDAGYQKALREYSSPQVQAELLERLAVQVTSSLITAHHTLNDVMVNSKFDLARVNAAAEAGKTFDRLVKGNDRGKGEEGKGDTFIIHVQPKQREMKDITPDQPEGQQGVP